MSLLRGTGARLAAGATLALLAVSGCSATQTQTPVAIPSSSPTPAPLFANDEEALAAAKKAYAAYESISDLILREGGEDSGRVKPFTSAELAETDMAAYSRARSNGWHSTGESAFDNLTLQSVDESAPHGVAVISAYLCSDVSEVDVLNRSGKSIVAASRKVRIPFLVTFDLQSSGSADLVVGSREVWEGEGVC
ncbi:glycosyltransferase family protein [Cryobacterium tepidiphilum]|uniref:hypothetical protein n=1 Tax=Cryobacterium tepidiphilum TaxID=2486026 RepID=UPI0011CE165A|nr:hypothetical protein [Cryobacterium tepidiphilum]